MLEIWPHLFLKDSFYEMAFQKLNTFKWELFAIWLIKAFADFLLNNKIAVLADFCSASNEG